MSHNEIDRRSFLGALWVGGFTVLSTPHSTLVRSANDARYRFPLVRAIRHPESATVIGQAYLQDAAESMDPGKLNELILETLNVPVDGAAATGATELRRRIRERVRADFSHGRTVRVNGWILSQTEARVAALVALS